MYKVLRRVVEALNQTVPHRERHGLVAMKGSEVETCLGQSILYMRYYVLLDCLFVVLFVGIH